MPQGVYPSADVCALGDQISSTGEGRHVTLYADNLTHGSGVSYVTKGRPVMWGEHAVGMPFRTQAAGENELEAVDTEGIWCVDVVASNDAGNSAVAPGEQLYMNTTTGVVSKISDGATQICLGYALGNVTSGATERIAVKVHFDPSLDNAKRTYYTVTSGVYTYGKHHTSVFAGGTSTGLEYFDQQVTGTQTGGIYGLGTWMELAAGFTSTASLTVGFEVGIYDAGATLTTSRFVMQQIQGIFASAVDSLHIWRINIAAAGGAVTAWMAFANPTSAGFVATAAETSTLVGCAPVADIVGYGVLWARLYDAAT